MPRKDPNAWMYHTLGTPATAPAPPNKGRELARSRVNQGGKVVPKSPAELAGEARREGRRRERAKAGTSASDPGKICLNCGKVVSGPHRGEHADPQSAELRQGHEYRGHHYSGGYCEDCEPKNQRDFLGSYMRYRREHPKTEE